MCVIVLLVMLTTIGVPGVSAQHVPMSQCHWIMMGTRKEEVRDIELVVDECEWHDTVKSSHSHEPVLQHWQVSLRGRDQDASWFLLKLFDEL